MKQPRTIKIHTSQRIATILKEAINLISAKFTDLQIQEYPSSWIAENLIDVLNKNESTMDAESIVKLANSATILMLKAGKGHTTLTQIPTKTISKEF